MKLDPYPSQNPNPEPETYFISVVSVLVSLGLKGGGAAGGGVDFFYIDEKQLLGALIAPSEQPSAQPPQNSHKQEVLNQR